MVDMHIISTGDASTLTSQAAKAMETMKVMKARIATQAMQVMKARPSPPKEAAVAAKAPKAMKGQGRHARSRHVHGRQTQPLHRAAPEGGAGVLEGIDGRRRD